MKPPSDVRMIPPLARAPQARPGCRGADVRQRSAHEMRVRVLVSQRGDQDFIDQVYVNAPILNVIRAGVCIDRATVH
jgi:hypothetical protein